ncbi:glycoside hydrolase family 16 protein [Nonlabens xiamenensis]|uniref:glycoside hydrolase family 16 protein n=1 Tax=Nonlabens xiamenensis TaxID=2341043 RepID=UPI000F6104A9|nr:glycoside hydrolase family 16 protein [Nonlabens xiamenensis]
MHKMWLGLLSLILFIGCDTSPDFARETPDDGSQTIDPADFVNVGNQNGLPDFTAVGGINRTEAPAGWQLEWSEEFETGLDLWSSWEGGAFNNELQLYQMENIATRAGVLYLRSKREAATGDVTPFDNTQRSFNFTSGRLTTNRTFGPQAFANGVVRFAARVKLPAGEGLWPAFWSFGDPWPTQGEIDILEFRGNATDQYVTNIFYGDTAGTPLTNSATLTSNNMIGEDITTEWHIFELIWSQNELEMLFDGSTVKTYTDADSQYIDDMFDKQQNIILNLAIGGDFFNGQNLDENNIPNEAFYGIDWVRVYTQQ